MKADKNEALTEEKQVESEAKTNVNEDVALDIEKLREFSDENGILKYIGNLLNKCFHNEDGTDLGLKKLRLVLEPRQWTDDQQIEIFYEEEKDESSKRARRQNILSKIISYGITILRVLHVDDELCIIAKSIMEAVKVSEYIMLPTEESNVIKVNVTISIRNTYKIADEIKVLAKANNQRNMIHIDDIGSSKLIHQLGFVKNIHCKSFDPFLSNDKTINKSRMWLLKTISKLKSRYLHLRSKKERFMSCGCVCILPAEDRYGETKRLILFLENDIFGNQCLQ